MNHRLLSTLMLACAFAVSTVSAEETRKAGENPRAVLPQARRTEVLKKADELLQIVPAGSEDLTAELPDPFYAGMKRPKDKRPGAGEVKVEIPADQLLARAAELIKPQGTFVIGADAYLQLLDGKRYKVGDTISLNIDGLGVQVTVSSIQRNSYTLRLNDQELRRDFK